MSKLKNISTDKAPSAIGAYSQAIKAGDFIFISGQIPLDPSTMEIVSDDFSEQVMQVLKNLNAVANEANCSLDDIIKITVYLKNLEDFQSVNTAMSKMFTEPYPARAAVEVSRLPKDVLVEMDAIIYLGD
ncbi:MAG: RidA family protein [Pseudomonadota bacterium]|nr:RidA family protein [Pseudomonadota bacterium]